MNLRDCAIGALIGAGTMVAVQSSCRQPPASMAPAIPWQAIELNDKLRQRAEFAEYRIKGLEKDIAVLRDNWEQASYRAWVAGSKLDSLLHRYFERINVQPREVTE